MNLYELKTYHEVIDEIYYKVTHLEPWEKGSRKTAGQTGMCGGVSMKMIFQISFVLYFLCVKSEHVILGFADIGTKQTFWNMLLKQSRRSMLLV